MDNLNIEFDKRKTMETDRTNLQQSPNNLDDIRKNLEELKKRMNEDEMFKNDVSEQEKIDEEKRRLTDKLRQYHFPQCPLYNHSRPGAKVSKENTSPTNLMLSGDDDFNTSFGDVGQLSNVRQPKLGVTKNPTANRFTNNVNKYGNSLKEIEKLCTLQQQKIRESIANIRQMTGQLCPDTDNTGVLRGLERDSNFLKECSFNFVDSNIPLTGYDTRKESVSAQRQSNAAAYVCSSNLESLGERGDLAEDFESTFSNYLAKNK